MEEYFKIKSEIKIFRKPDKRSEGDIEEFQSWYLT
jgi:hypothetical protein